MQYLKIHDVTAVFRSNRDVISLSYPNIELADREQVVLTGPSGSGKSTLLHLVAGLMTPQTGEITFQGKVVSGLSERRRDLYRALEIGYLFQDFHLMQDFTALENVLLGLRVAGVDSTNRRARAEEVLKAMDIDPQARRPVRLMSAGERQRVALARAVAHRPSLLLADEPTAHLDKVRAEKALELLISTATDLRIGLLVVTHDPIVVQAFSREIELTR